MTNPAPEYYMIKIDERKHWRDDIQGKTTAVYSVYAFDRNTHVHLCELTPSYCLMFLGHDYVVAEGLSETEYEELDAKVTEGLLDSEPVTYMHARTVESLLKQDPTLMKKVDIDLVADESLSENEQWNADFDSLVEGWHTGALRF